MILNLIVILNVVVIFLFFLQLNRKNKNKASGREMKKQDLGDTDTFNWNCIAKWGHSF